MNRIISYGLIALALVGVFIFVGTKPSVAANSPEKDLITISPEGQKVAGIKVEVINLRQLPIYLSAPGEVIPNLNLSSIVSPRAIAQVLSRLVEVGDHVKKSQPLVRMTSVTVAKEQAQLLLAMNEWRRVKSLGKNAVSVKRYQNAEVNYQQCVSKLLAYGMTKDQVESFLKMNDPNKANGEFTLLSPRTGTILSAGFTEGQMVKPGDVLFQVVNESILWVDAMLGYENINKIKKGDPVVIKTAKDELPATVLRIHHKLQPITRTRTVRIQVPNDKHLLHPGEFVTCLISVGISSPVMAVPTAAVMRNPDGDKVVYIEVKTNYFKGKKMRVTKKIDDFSVIDGIQPGTRVVTKGALFVHSEILKSGFNIHNH